MKTLFIEARFEGKISLDKIKVDRLPEKIGLATTVQFVGLVDDVKGYLVKKGKKVFVGKGRQKHKAQILGCDISSVEKLNVDAFLYIGDGRFHPIALAKLKKDVFVFNPYTGVFKRLDSSEVERYEKRKKAAYIRFLSSDNIGILVSTKPGQDQMKKAMEFKKKIDKNCFVFLFDDLDFSELENFNFIDCWVNTACPRLIDDYDKFNKPVINIDDVR